MKPPKKAIEYYDEFAPEYDKLAIDYYWFSPKVMFGMLFDKICPNQKLLDIGIGTGLSSEPFKKMGMEIYGVDGSSEMLKICKRKNIAIDLQKIDLENSRLKYEDEFFDMVIANGVLYFLANIENVLAESVRVLKHNGILCINFEELSDGINEEYRNISNCVISEKLKEKTGVVVYKYNIDYVKNIISKLNVTIKEVLRYFAYKSPTTKEDVYFTLLVLQKGGDR
ncbi:class I SAM-dependent DNA methyltransferase [Desulfonauticus submarinus]